MSLQLATLIFNDSASEKNRDLIEFLRRNLEASIKKGGLTFDYTIITPGKLLELRNSGIKHLPAMKINNYTYTGVSKIIEEIRRRIQLSKNLLPEKSDDEILLEYNMQQMNGETVKDANGRIHFTDDNDDQEQDFKLNANRLCQEAMARRGTVLPTQNEINPVAAGTARNQQRDDIEEKKAAPAQQPRRDNVWQEQKTYDIGNTNMRDALESLQNIKDKNGGSDAATEDAMMQSLLENMSD